jgi:hypothetical protein
MAETTAQQGHVLSDKIAEVVLSDGRVCEVFPVKLWNVSLAIDEDPYKQLSKLMSLSTLLDGEVASAQTFFEMYVMDIERIAKYIK